MRVGRPPLRAAHVDGLDGGVAEKERLKTILETLSGELTILEACERLSIGTSRFHELRQEALQAALEGLAPGVPGRPPKEVALEAERLEELEHENGWLREELELSRTRTELALVMPHILREPKSEPPGRWGKQPARARRKRKRSGARRNGTARG